MSTQRRRLGLGSIASWTILASCALASTASGADIETPSRTAAEWYAMGGWVMHLLVACSIGAVAVTAERLVALRPGAVGATTERVRDALARGCGSEEADRICALESASMRQNLGLLSALASLATMLGLLGTVLGMVDAFDRIAVAGTGDARVVADGIFRALVTTAAGLSVAVATTACHALLRRRVERCELGLAELCQEAADLEASEPEANRARELSVAPEAV